MLATATFSQFTINSTYNLVAGDNYRMDMYDEVVSIDPGPSGTNISWDFSTISGGVYIPGEPAFCVDPAGTPYADSAAVAGANLCIRGEGTGNEGPFAYYSFTNTEQTMLGIGNTQGGGVSFTNYTDPLTGITFPCSYGSVMDDTYKYLLYNSTSGMYFMKDSGSVHTVVDAWGSITTPEAHYDNVIRFTTTTTSTMWMNFGTGWTPLGTSTDIHYSWYAENIKTDVFSITEFVDVGGYSVKYLADHNFPVGIIEQEDVSFSIYPNPASERVHIKCEKEMTSVSIFSLDGRRLESRQIYGINETSLELNQHPGGIYLIEVRYGHNEVLRERLLIQ